MDLSAGKCDKNLLMYKSTIVVSERNCKVPEGILRLSTRCYTVFRMISAREDRSVFLTAEIFICDAQVAVVVVTKLN